MNDIFQYRKFFSPGIIFLATIFFSSESVCRIFLKSPIPPPPPSSKVGLSALNYALWSVDMFSKALFTLRKILFFVPKKPSVNRKPFLVQKVFFSTITRLTDAVENMSRIFKGHNFLSHDKILCCLTAILCWVMLFREHGQLKFL